MEWTGLLRRSAQLLAVAALAGCATQSIHEVRATFTSGVIGCPVSEVETSEHEKLTWTASCRGRVFYCTGAGTPSCAEAIKKP